MENFNETYETIDVTLEDGTIIKFETSSLGKEDVSITSRPIKELCNSIESIVAAIYQPLKNSKATKASVKFGIDVALESGQLTALIVKGNTKANLEITLEWSSEKKDEQVKPQ